MAEQRTHSSETKPKWTKEQYETEMWKHLTESEGVSNRIYTDGKGIPTMGVGVALAVLRGEKYVLRKQEEIGAEITGDKNAPYLFKTDEWELLQRVVDLINTVPLKQEEAREKVKNAQAAEKAELKALYEAEKAKLGALDEAKEAKEAKLKALDEAEKAKQAKQAKLDQEEVDKAAKAAETEVIAAATRLIPKFVKNEDPTGKNKFGFTLSEERMKDEAFAKMHDARDRMLRTLEKIATELGWSSQKFTDYKEKFLNSPQEAALTSLQYNGVSARNTLAAMLDGDLPKMRWEILYGSNPLSNGDSRKGISKRRRAEADMATGNPAEWTLEEQDKWRAYEATPKAKDYRREFPEAFKAHLSALDLKELGWLGSIPSLISSAHAGTLPGSDGVAPPAPTGNRLLGMSAALIATPGQAALLQPLDRRTQDGYRGWRSGDPLKARIPSPGAAVGKATEPVPSPSPGAAMATAQAASGKAVTTEARVTNATPMQAQKIEVVLSLPAGIQAKVRGAGGNVAVSVVNTGQSMAESV